MEKFLEFLGEENIEKLKSGIVDIILENISNDFRNSTVYLLDPDDVQEFVEKCKERAFKELEDEYVEKIKNQINF